MVRAVDKADAIMLTGAREPVTILPLIDID